jgi:hypothetical protein
MFNFKKGEKMKKINVGDIVELTKRWDSANAFVKKGSRGIVISTDEYATVSIFDQYIFSNDYKRNKYPIRVQFSNLTK